MEQSNHRAIEPSSNRIIEQSFDLSGILPVYLGITIISFLLIIGAGYFLGRSYAAEYFFKKSLDGLAKNNAKTVYNNMRLAIVQNPYLERFRVSFSQVNLLIANNIASKTQTNESNKTNGSNMSEQDRQTISQAIQAAIAEAKAAVSLNSQKASNWENLAVIYRNIMNVAQGADVWTISSYQRAIVLDPQNPVYRLNLGGVYYSLANYDEAIKLFEQAAALKQDWPNAHYNLAWAAYNRANYQRAAAEMQNVLTLLNPVTDKVDYEKAMEDLANFKKKLPGEGVATNEAELKQPQLNLPTPQPTIEPKIKLPKEASPEAR